jgi:hypothetical protein
VGGHLALHLLVACPGRIAGAIIIDPLGAHLAVLEEFGERLLAPMTDGDRARVGEIEAKENAGTATPEESKECLSLFWPSYFADPSTAPPMPEIDVSPTVYPATMASIRAHGDASASGSRRRAGRAPGSRLAPGAGRDRASAPGTSSGTSGRPRFATPSGRLPAGSSRNS